MREREYPFEWDTYKADLNFRKHQISFEEGVTIFTDFHLTTISDPEHSIDEQRFIGIDFSDKNRMLIVSFTERGEKYRIISCRKATPSREKSMKKAEIKPAKMEEDDLRAEYDFRGGVRGRHYRPLEKGYVIYIHQPDGTTVVKHMKLEKGMVRLHPDVQEYFPDAQAVDHALRSLIALIPKRAMNPTRGIKNGQQAVKKTRTQARTKSKSTNSR